MNFTNASKYENQYNFKLSEWQLQAVKAIIEGNNVIVMAPTGSGKTLPAEIAIKHLSKLNNPTERNKIIYCSPIKALTNEKKYEFNEKFKDTISIGVRTGDITFNENADVLLCTTEILRNNLSKYNNTEKKDKLLDFEMNPEKELAAVIYDEIHNMFYNKERGTVWEESLMDLPKTTQIIGLSATLDNPLRLCSILTNMNGKKTILCSNTKRIVPLEHRLLYFAPQNITKKLPNKCKEFILNNYNETNDILLKNDYEGFKEEQYNQLVKLDKMIFNNKPKHLHTNQHYIINKTTEFLYKNNKLPAIIFVMSRKKCFDFAYKVTTKLLDDDSDIPHTIGKKAKQLLINKMSNWKEYVDLPQWQHLIRLLEKGIAVHHSGVIPIFREIIEILFKEKYIKLLFATESMGIGVNMPVKATIHTSIKKFTDGKHRYFRPDEYNQMAGRAGRRGQDKFGYSYLLFNLFRKNPIISPNQLQFLLSGKSQPMHSQFQLNCDLLLKLAYQKYDKTQILNYIKKSIYYNEIHREHIFYLQKICELYETTSKEEQITQEFISKIKNIENKNNKLLEYVPNTIDHHLKYLTDEKFIENDSITLKGEIAMTLQEIPSLTMASFIVSLKNNDKLKYYTSRQWIAFLSIFTPIKLASEDKIISINNINIDENVKTMISKFEKTLDWFYAIEIEKLNSGRQEKYNIHYDMCEIMYDWSLMKDDEISNINHCKQVIKEVEYWGISLGDFIKAIHKINSIAKEMEKVAILLEDLDFLSTIKNIPKILLKYVITNDSMYI